VTVSVPYFGAARYIRRAVDSLLTQTHRNLTVVVINDGDPHPPWRQLEDISDPRLVRFSLSASYGPYFAHHVVLSATPDSFLLIQDADDWSAPERLSLLLETLQREAAVFAFSAEWQLRERGHGTLSLDTIRWAEKARAPQSNVPRSPRTAADGRAQRFLFDPYLNDTYVNRASHHALFRRDSLKAIGGYYGGYRMNYDTLLTNVLMMTGHASFVKQPLYYYVIRRDSLSHAAATNSTSALRQRVKIEQAELYRRSLHVCRLYLKQQISRIALVSRIREICTRNVRAESHRALRHYATRLAHLLRGQKCQGRLSR
jgi:glycosyltransferase involved in cell wall biosynthesis